jgi:hypothetical protein
MPFRAIVVASVVVCGSAAAQTKPAPGLWEYRMTGRGTAGVEAEASMAQMREQMAKMSPQERAQVEAMLRQSGIGLPGAAGAPMTLRVCVTPEDAARGLMPSTDASCTQSPLERSGNTVRFRFSCTGEPPTSGEGEATYTSDKALKGRVVTTTVKGGRSERNETATEAIWLGADCAGVKSRLERLPTR